MAKPGRNEPCPCGSAKKFKFCHGAVPVVVSGAQGLPEAQRECGGCTACCQGWAEGEIRGQRMFPGQHCHFLTEGACSIYEERPQSPCKNFVCGWLAPGSPFPDHFRPDLAGVIIVGMRWQGRPAHVLLSAGNDPSVEMLAWMRAHANATGAPFFYAQQGSRVGYGPPDFQREMALKVQRGERLW